MEEHLYSILSDALSFPIAWGTTGQGSDLPRAAMFRQSAVRDMTLDGPALMRGRVQIDCYGATYQEAISASRDVRGVLEGYAGGPVQGAFLNTARDMNIDGAEILFRVSLDFSVTYRE